MFNKGVETNVENIFSVPFPPNKLKDALMSSQYLEGINNYWREWCVVDIIIYLKTTAFFLRRDFPVNLQPWAENNYCAFKTWQ